jgi:FAD/FMN-containing dehydrogenase
VADAAIGDAAVADGAAADGAVPALLSRLERDLDGEVAADDYTRHLFSRDASMYSIMPACVVFPRHAGDVAAAVTSAAEHGVPVTARGAGTSLAGQTTSPGLVLDLSLILLVIILV